jgi:hypothetical protein
VTRWGIAAVSAEADDTSELIGPAKDIGPLRAGETRSHRAAATMTDKFVSEAIVDPGEQTQLGYHVSEPSTEAAERPVTVEIIRDPNHPEPKSASASQFRRIARAVAARLAKELAVARPDGANIPGADVSPRLRKETDPWRVEANPSGCSDRTDTTDDGESSWSQQEAKRLLRTMSAKKKRGRSSDR